jgi:alkanesulfonate monooxygenase SsuD/methylene tetrahydromethanopterin reductase-like flavin-dependent oxidoreductase (luciferase family)
MTRQLRLGAFMRPVGIHTAWWRYPGAAPEANFSWPLLKRFAQTLERGRFDAFFMADHLALLNMPMSALKRSATVTSFDPLTLLPALAVVTERLGLIATASTTYNEPYHIARKFASLDHLSGGRAGWNLVTTSNPDAALNFGLDEAGNSTTWSPGCGTVGRTTRSCSTRTAACSSTPTGCTCSATRASISRCAGR